MTLELQRTGTDIPSSLQGSHGEQAPTWTTACYLKMTLWPPTNLRYMESVIKEVTETELKPSNLSKEDDLFLSW